MYAKCALHKKFAYYAGIMLNAFAILNYAGIVGSSLPLNWIIYTIQIVGYARLGVTNVITNSQKGVQILAFYSMISHEISLAKPLASSW